MKDTAQSREATTALQQAATIVAYADEDGKGEHVRRAPMDAAERSHGRLILYALRQLNGR